jgi:phosphatidylinositol alpha 1,6-mannosyltransferase
MRIAFCTDILPPVADGVTRTLSELAPALLADGAELLFLTPMRPHPSLPWRDRVHRIPGVPFPFYPSYRMGLPLGVGSDAVLDRFAPDVVHVVTPSLLGLYGVRYGERRGVPVVASFHTNFAALFAYYGIGPLEWLGRRLMRRFYNRCAATLAPSRTTAAELRAAGIRNVTLWWRGVDHARFAPTFRSAVLRMHAGAGNAPVLLYVGRLAREKNLDYLVAAVRELEGRGTVFRLVIAGDGPMRRRLATLLPRAHFTGHLRQDQLAAWYASADVFVFPAANETFGNVVLEAFASGLPVVAVARGGVQELVRPGRNGYLAPPDAPAVFAEITRALLERPALLARLSENARATAARYHWPDVTRRLLACYGHVLGAYAPPVESAEAVAVADGA